MRHLLLVSAIVVTACGDASTTIAKDAAPPSDDAAPAADDAAAPVEASATTDASGPSQGPCAACTANECLAQLQACGGSQSCVNDLVSFNDCLAAEGGDCGSTFSSGGAAQESLWSCLSTKCASTCGTN